MSRLLHGVLLALLLTLLLGSMGAMAADYDLDVDGAIDTPTETIEGHEVSGLGVVDPGEDLQVDVTAPDDFTVEMVNSDERLEDWEDGSGSETVTFGTSDLSSGAYTLRLYDGGSLEGVFPIVVNGYDITVDGPDTVADDEAFELAIEVTPTERDDQPDEVRVVFWDGDDETNLVADHESEDEYTVSVSESELDVGEYDVYATAITDEETAHETREPLAVSDVSTLEVTDRDESDSNGDDENGSDSNDGGESDSDNGGESESDGDEMPTDNGTDDDANETSTDGGTDDTGMTDDTGTAADDGSNTSDTNTADEDDAAGTIAPNDPDTTDDESADEQPIGAVPAILGAIVAIGLYARVRSAR